MSRRKAQALIWQKNASLDQRTVETIPRDLHEMARRSLTKLFRDSLSLNDQAKHESTQQRDSVEDDIIEDFQIVAEYIHYLLLQLDKKDVVLDDK